MWRVIYLVRYAWFVNYLFLVVKISFSWGFSDNNWFKTVPFHDSWNFVKTVRDAWILLKFVRETGSWPPLCHLLSAHCSVCYQVIQHGRLLHGTEFGFTATAISTLACSYPNRTPEKRIGRACRTWEIFKLFSLVFLAKHFFPPDPVSYYGERRNWCCTFFRGSTGPKYWPTGSRTQYRVNSEAAQYKHGHDDRTSNWIVCTPSHGRYRWKLLEPKPTGRRPRTLKMAFRLPLLWWVLGAWEWVQTQIKERGRFHKCACHRWWCCTTSGRTIAGFARQLPTNRMLRTRMSCSRNS